MIMFINNDTELLIKNDESIFDDNPEISQYELNNDLGYALKIMKNFLKIFI